ncbi:MAG: MFS transporter [Planctomycetes bacterium]|nr:MFS transporter [Planctomycetota bacterium]MCD7896850.1 MFS transporter [Planctomycetaceae bacterium]
MDNRTNRFRILAMTIGAFLTFFTFGFIDVLKGSTLPAVLDEMGYSYSRGGVIVMAAYFGFCVASLVTGFIADIKGKKAVVVIACLFYIGGIVSYAGAGSMILFVLAFFLIGFACGSAELAGNYIIIDVQRQNPGLYLNLLTAFYGLACMLAPLYAGQLFRAGFSWRDVYTYGLAVPIILLVYILLARYPKLEGGGPSRLDFRELFRTAFTPTMCWVYVLNFSYVAAEVCIATWLVEYLRVMRDMPIDSGSTWLAVYFGGIMAGRFVGGFFVDRVGYIKSIAIAIVMCIVCIVTGIVGPGHLVFSLAATGLFLSIILPTATALVSTMGLKNMGAILGLFFFFVGLGGMAGPWIAGVVNDWLGLRAGMATAAAFCVVMLVSLVRIKQRMRADGLAAK